METAPPTKQLLMLFVISPLSPLVTHARFLFLKLQPLVPACSDA